MLAINIRFSPTLARVDVEDGRSRVEGGLNWSPIH